MTFDQHGGHPLAPAEGRSGEPPALRDHGEWADEMRCVAKHLAVAASELNREGRYGPEIGARLAAAESQFRSLASACDGVDPSGTRAIPATPSVRIDGATTVPLVALLLKEFGRDRWWLNNSSIDPDLVAGAKELLCDLRWQLPHEAPATRG